MSRIFSKGFFVLLILLFGIIGLGYWLMQRPGAKQEFALSSLSVASKVSKLLPIEDDTKKEIEAAEKLSQAVFKKDGVTRTYLIMLQNNYELRPGGGFLGQYGILKVKDGQVISTFVEDANLLDQRINIKVTPPYPLTRKLQLKRWKFRDSNFSPDFPTNAEKAMYFYRLAGGGQQFDGVIAVNSTIFDRALEITGPIQVPGYPETFSSPDGSIKLQERVEKAYLGDDVAAAAKQNRKAIMRPLANELVKRLTQVENIPKALELGQAELHEKDIMLYFKDPALQQIVNDAKWGGIVNTDWKDDYLMLVDANMGALKSDYYMKRAIDYFVDFTGEHPTATVTYTYTHTATHGDWKTSDYHTYLRAYVPEGSTLLERKLVSYPLTDKAFGKTYFGVFVDTLINGSTAGMIKYQLPDSIKPDNYKLLIEKQSGIGTIPVTITVKTKEKEIKQTADLKRDLVFSLQEVEERK